MTTINSQNLEYAAWLQQAEQVYDSLKLDNRSDFFRWSSYQSTWGPVKIRGHHIWYSGKFDQVVWLGIGGSALGPQMIFEAQGLTDRVMVLDNLDASLYQRFCQWLKSIDRTHFVIVSKSGSTLETLVLTERVVTEFGDRIRFSDQVTVISDSANNDLVAWAERVGAGVLYMPKGVGGRFSLLTPVGLLAAMGAGLNWDRLESFLRKEEDQRRLVTLLIAQSLAAIQQKADVVYFFLYSSAWRLLGLWLVQLWNESLGKSGSGAPFLASGVGSVDQHSTLQYLMESPKKVWTFIFDVLDQGDTQSHRRQSLFPSVSWAMSFSFSQIRSAQAQATYEALSRQGHMVSHLPVVSDLSVEELFWWSWCLMSWVAGLGVALGINPFDQPGVELSKKITKDHLAAARG